MELQGRLEELHARGLGLAAISYDSPDILAEFSRRHGITFPLLSDVGSATIKAYGILNTVAEDALGAGRNDTAVQADVKKYVSATGSLSAAEVTRGTPFPGTFVIGRDGRVTSRYFEEFYRERSTASSIMMKLGGRAAPISATKISTDYLDVTTYPSDTVVAPGNRFALVVNVAPRSRIHVYAPGATGYRVVSLNIASQPFVRVLPIRYPLSEIYFFKPLNERVPVYQKPFALLQEAVIEVTPEAERALREKKTLALTGALEYQACNDSVCFNPALIPLSWTLALRPNITERPYRPR